MIDSNRILLIIIVTAPFVACNDLHWSDSNLEITEFFEFKSS